MIFGRRGLSHFYTKLHAHCPRTNTMLCWLRWSHHRLGSGTPSPTALCTLTVTPEAVVPGRQGAPLVWLHG